MVCNSVRWVPSAAQNHNSGTQNRCGAMNIKWLSFMIYLTYTKKHGTYGVAIDDNSNLAAYISTGPSSAAPPLAPPTRIEQLQMPRNCALADLICVFPPFISTSEILCTQTLFEYLFYYYFILV
ncbi:unnamed protein product [Aspergillus oryzae RIB40]|uniref:DNA, SC102 n=1 Tax=Aspergillus oryzae (strain ATCC 42149 / RIB 40) TaxID=510516 RepID=Q2UAU0_ASPOR|nr:unnamed protein product [Aspergillus oryzae RIB40]BAE61325.1 unnamed protein product [Aspergillus oryzae RIB40]